MTTQTDATQQHFLGCSIRNFNLNIGWADQSTTLSVGLVEDDSLFERFDAFIGQLVRFQYEEWTFDGILSNIHEQKSESGNRLWEVVISDPRELLGGIQLITNGYTGFTYSVPNLYNIYGYLESFGFGGSQKTASGIPWRLVKDAFTRLNQTTPVYLAGTPYFVDITSLPDVSGDYRINSTNISLLDFIQEICGLANYEFTVILIGNYIKVITVSNNIPQLNSSIYRLLNSINGFVSMDAGFELQYNTTNKFLVGAQVEQMYFQYNNVGNTTSVSGININPVYDDTISRYWGKDLSGNVILAERAEVKRWDNPQKTEESFYIDGKPLTWTGNAFYQYHTDTEELRAAAVSFESWSGFLSIYDNDKDSIHYKKYQKFFLKATEFKLHVLKDIMDDATSDPNNPWAELHTVSAKDLMSLERSIHLENNNDVLVQKAYDYISTYAREYLDRKFMVRIPFVYAKRNETFGSIDTTLEPTESGYIEESLFPRAVATKILPEYNDFISTEENKLTCYVRFGPFNYVDLDVSSMTEDDYYFQHPYLFVKAEVGDEVVFLNKNTAFSPRVIITLPTPIKFFKTDPLSASSSTLDQTETLSIIGQAFVNHNLKLYSNVSPISPPRTDQEIKDRKERLVQAFKNWSHAVGADVLFIDTNQFGLVPQMAAIPLKDNTRVYGPWYTQSIGGKTEFEQDFDLAPWNFGGFTLMNQAGTAMVQDAYSAGITAETGSVEFPGPPVLKIATQIYIGGPVITGIGVTVSEAGVTTTYRMERWNQSYGKETRQRIEQFKQAHSLRRQNSRNFRKLFKPNAIPTGRARAGTGFQSLNNRPRRGVPRTTHPVIMADVYEKENGFKASNISAVPFYQIPTILDNENWENVAGMSMDGLFVPYTTDVTSSGMPHFESPSGTGSPNVDDLNPFQAGHNIGVAVRGTGVSGHRDINSPDEGEEDTYRGIALKTPMVLSGWGKDINNVPVPNISGSYISGHLQDIVSWKTGPLDIRWDDDRKVWVAGGTIPKYVRDNRVLTVSGSIYIFQYELVTNGSGHWTDWFTMGNCYGT